MTTRTSPLPRKRISPPSRGSAAVSFATKVRARSTITRSLAESEDTKAGVKAAQDDKFYDTIMGRHNNADHCARGVVTTYFTGTAKQDDYAACVRHVKELYKDPVGTIAETTGIRAGQELWGCGNVCGGVLGFLLGPHVTQWLTNFAVGVGIKNCLSKGLGVPQQTLDNYSRIIQSPGLIADAQAPAAFYTLAAKTADIWVNDGLQNCRDEGWWKGAAATYKGNVEILAAESASRAQAFILAEAGATMKKALGDEECLVDDVPSKKCRRVASAAFVKATLYNKNLTDWAIAELNYNIAHFQPGTLTAGSTKDDWLNSQEQKDVSEEGAQQAAQAEILLADAIQPQMTEEECLAVKGLVWDSTAETCHVPHIGKGTKAILAEAKAEAETAKGDLEQAKTTLTAAMAAGDVIGAAAASLQVQDATVRLKEAETEIATLGGGGSGALILGGLTLAAILAAVFLRKS